MPLSDEGKKTLMALPPHQGVHVLSSHVLQMGAIIAEWAHHNQGWEPETMEQRLEAELCLGLVETVNLWAERVREMKPPEPEEMN